MNYFELHVGDYEAATAHLTMLEDAAYGRMLRVYYRTEAPLPADIKKVCRLVRAQSKPERDAVEQVLREFFELQADGWHQGRADAELQQFRASEPEREARKANEDARIKRHRDERAALFKLLNDNGQHAPWNTKIEELRRLAAPFSNATATAPETPAVTEPATAPVTPATAPHGNVSPPPTSHIPGKEKENPQPPEGGKRRRKPNPEGSTCLRTWLESLKTRQEQPVPPDDPVFAYAQRVGLPRDFLGLAWRQFRHRYSEQHPGKRYRDWRRVFRNAVEGNWLKLWWLDPASGQYALTTVGLQAQRSHEQQQGGKAA